MYRGAYISRELWVAAVRYIPGCASGSTMSYCDLRGDEGSGRPRPCRRYFTTVPPCAIAVRRFRDGPVACTAFSPGGGYEFQQSAEIVLHYLQR